MDSLLQDVRYALRRLRATPGFAAVAVFTLALGLGVNTIVFSAANAVFFPPQPVVEPERIVRLAWHSRLRPQLGGTGLSYPEFLEIAGRTELFESVCGTTLSFERPLTIAGDTIAVSGHLVTADCFRMRGERALRGRLLGPEDHSNPEGQAVAVISEELWRSRFGGRDDAIGASLRFGGRELEVVGVAPKGSWVPLWLPYSLLPEVAAFPAPRGFMTDRTWRHVHVTARLRPGVTLEQAQARAPALTLTFADADPMLPAEQTILVSQPFVWETPTDMAWLLALSSVVLLIACANLAGLLLARGVARSKEVAVRMAIGASRSRLLRQLMVENLALALAAGAAAFVMTLAFAAALPWFEPPAGTMWQRILTLQIDWRVLAFTLSLAILTALVFGLGPAISSTRTDVGRNIGGGDVVIPGGHRRLLSARGVLLVGQFAVSMLFVLVSGVFVAGFLKVSSVEPGIGRPDAGAVNVVLRVQRPTHESVREFADQIRRRAAESSGLYAVALTSTLPAGGAAGGLVHVEGPRDGAAQWSATVIASPGLFDALGIPLLHGRDFTDQDRHDTPQVAIVSDAAARRWWPGQNPLGKRVYYRSLGGEYEVVGVAANTRGSVNRNRQEIVYLPLAQQQPWGFTVVASSREGPGAAVERIRRLIAEIDPDTPIGWTRSVRQWLDGFLYRQWISAAGFGTLAGLALFLASLGLYGSMAYAVSQQARELGMRMVLGADGAAIRRMVLWQGFRLAIIGAAVGGYAAALAIDTIVAFTAAVPGWTWSAYLLGPAVMVGVALLASYLPARRAARVDPMVTLRAL